MITVRQLHYKYSKDAEPALRDINFEVLPGELLLCTGASGSGKSTLLRVLNGIIPHHVKGHLTGNVTISDFNVRDHSPAEIATIAGTLFQDPERQFFALNVREELGLALQWRGWDKNRINTAVEKAAERMHITHMLDNSIFHLSEGQKQKVAIASLLAAEPKALIFDEPSANLDPESANELAAILGELKRGGLALVVADHRLAWLRHEADSALVLHQGAQAEYGPPALLDDDLLRNRYGLRNVRHTDPRPTLPDMDQLSPVFLCEDMTFGYKNARLLWENCRFAFPGGKVTALTGPNGVGKTTLARLCSGLQKAQSARFSLRGVPVKARYLPRHVQVVLQNAGHQLRMNSVCNELMSSLLSLGIHAGESRHMAEESLRDYHLNHLSDRHPQSLSGGEKQRLAVACAAIRKPAVLFLDEPTSGLDGANMRRIAAGMEKAAQNGSAVLVITHDLELMANTCTAKLNLSLPAARAL